MTAQDIEDNGFREFEGLTNYIEVLIDSFPKPISRKELAQKTDVSQAAISKVKDRLLKLCDYKTLIFGHKLILRTDETFQKLLVLYSIRMQPTRILLSNYGWEIIRRMNLHSKISERFKEYPSHFNEKDTEVITKTVLYNLGNFQIVNQIRTSIVESEQRMWLLSAQYATAVQSILQKLDLPMKETEDLRNYLTIRDKLFCLIKGLIWRQVEKASILRELSESERTTYLIVYSKTMDFYLRKLFGIGTNFIKQAAEKRGFEFRKEYERIGYFYVPLSKQ